MSIEQNVSLGILRAARKAAEEMIDDGRRLERQGQEALRDVAHAELRRRVWANAGHCGRCGTDLGSDSVMAEDGVMDHRACPNSTAYAGRAQAMMHLLKYEPGPKPSGILVQHYRAACGKKLGGTNYVAIGHQAVDCPTCKAEAERLATTRGGKRLLRSGWKLSAMGLAEWDTHNRVVTSEYAESLAWERT